MVHANDNERTIFCTSRDTFGFYFCMITCNLKDLLTGMHLSSVKTATKYSTDPWDLFCVIRNDDGPLNRPTLPHSSRRDLKSSTVLYLLSISVTASVIETLDLSYEPS